jgi:hypothetical protein
MSLLHAVSGDFEGAQLGESVRRGIRATCFWLGVVLPVVYLPLLFVSIRAFLAFLPIHAVSLVVGYSYAP